MDIGFLRFQIFFRKASVSFALFLMRSWLSVLLYIMSLFVWGNIVPLLVTFIGVIWCGIFKFILLGVHWALHWIFIRLLLCMFPSPHPLFRLQWHVHVFLAFLTSMFQLWLFFLRFSLSSLIFFFCGAYLLLGFQWSLHVTYSIFQLHNYYLVLFFNLICLIIIVSKFLFSNSVTSVIFGSVSVDRFLFFLLLLNHIFLFL